MRNLIISALTAGVVILGSSLPAAAQYLDQSEISQWSEAHIQVLTDLGVVVGYPDGTFRPNANVTREELSVLILNAMATLEDRVLSAQAAKNEDLYNQLADQQVALIKALTILDELTAKAALENNNYVAIGLVFTPDRDGDTIEATAEISAKLQVIELSDRLAISVRPFVNLNTELGVAATLDLDITDNLELFGGVGAAYRADENTLGGLTGTSDEVIPYGQVGLSLDLSNRAVLIVDGKIPFDSKESKEPTVGLSVGWKF